METIFEAWDRYKTIQENCPQHGLNAHQVVQTFYKGISAYTKQLVVSQGLIIKKNPTNGKAKIWENTLLSSIHQEMKCYEEDLVLKDPMV